LIRFTLFQLRLRSCRMKQSRRTVLFWIFSILLLGVLGFLAYAKIVLQPTFFTGEKKIFDIGVTVVFFIMFGLMANELLHWRKHGKRSEAFDLVLIIFIFISIYLATFNPELDSVADPIMNSIIGAFGIFIIFGAYELREYEVLNKLLIITAVTYNVIFIATLVNSLLHDAGFMIQIVEGESVKNWIIRNTAFSFSIWIILILGFALFGRKYMVVLRFMSPEYLTMFLYIIAWLAVRTLSLIWKDFLTIEEQRTVIYMSLLAISWIVYAISGPILDLMLGIKSVTKSVDEIKGKLEHETNPQKIKELKTEQRQYQKLLNLVEEVSNRVGLKKQVKVGFGKYPILNAMAYGAFFDKRIAIISSNINEIPADELKGIIGHELNHAKGLDTFILSWISTIQLLIFWMIPKWPATMYDYTFGAETPPYPIWVFIVVNFGITLIMYVFIRMLEGRADRRTRQNGFGNELAKGLYNLEGFYSSGREIGLDTMLLSEEKIIEYNKVDNYASTAQYLDQHMSNPKVGSLLSNLMNSHPPSYLRILAMYDEDDRIRPIKESIMPFILLGKGNRLKYSRNMKSAREQYRKMANDKFKSMFGIENYAAYLEFLKKKEIFEIKLNKVFLHIDEENFSVGMGMLKDLQMDDEICEPFNYVFSPMDVISPEENEVNVNPEKIIKYNTSHISSKTYIIPEDGTKLKELQFGAIYQLSKNKNAVLLSVKIDPLLQEEASKLTQDPKDIKKNYKQFRKLLRRYINYYFLDEEGNLIEKKWRYKLKFNLNSIYQAKGKQIFLKERSTLQILRLKEIEPNPNKFNFNLVCENSQTGKEKTYPLNSTLVIKDEFGLHFHSDSENFDDERKILEFLRENNTRTTIYLKKAVNNVETGYLNSIFYDSENPKENSYLVLKNIHTNEIKISLKKIETIVFSFDTIGIMSKGKLSLAERFMQKVVYWTHPELVYYP
jgi:Zn-dependent protease with chaperone function